MRGLRQSHQPEPTASGNRQEMCNYATMVCQNGPIIDASKRSGDDSGVQAAAPAFVQREGKIACWHAVCTPTEHWRVHGRSN